MSEIFPLGTKVKWTNLDGKIRTGTVKMILPSYWHIVLEDGTEDVVSVPAGLCKKYEPKLEMKKR